MQKIKTSSNFFFLFLIFINISNLFANTYKATKGYSELSKAIQNNYLVKEQTQQDCSQSQIIEFFSYSCPACYKIESKVSEFKNSIKNNDKIKFKKLPVVFHENWLNAAKLYFTVKKLDLGDKFNDYAFNTIHNNSSYTITEFDIRKMIDNFNLQHPKEKIDGRKFSDVFKSNIINRDVKQSMRLFYALNLKSSPVFVINGKYIVSPQNFNDLNTMFKVIKNLAESQKIVCSD